MAKKAKNIDNKITKIPIEYLPAAQTDLAEMIDYVAKENQDAALRILNEFDKSIAQLEQFPQSGVIPKDIRLQRLGYRMLIVEKYLIFYVYAEDVVEIRRIIHGSRKYAFLL